ncbi:MAG: hypothetical protein KME15_00365 [Drouetiella hepatica Uher 2000/2452]|uniref:Uncharacterized protein n=1 Tax=Drouetiella hepatica Uher 2000/2452 TaxID=904376 RepID=A0A951Q700_9CYAN|nr:hypothetical protein [Drouetiella hepatica Uher 2000/2452]
MRRWAYMEGAIQVIDYIERALERLKDWAGRLIEALLGPDAQPEPVPVPVRNDERRRS